MTFRGKTKQALSRPDNLHRATASSCHAGKREYPATGCPDKGHGEKGGIWAKGLQMRRAAKVDTAQQAIVDGLRAAGYRVEIIGRPVDLLVGKEEIVTDELTWSGEYLGGTGYCQTRLVFNWKLLEIKTPTQSGKRRLRADQESQDVFIRETNTPVVMNLDQALEALRGL